MTVHNTAANPPKGSFLTVDSVDGLLIKKPEYQALFKDFLAEKTAARNAALKELNSALNRGACSDEIQVLQDKVWHCTRNFGLSGTDASVVLGQNPYRTKLELFNEKTGRVIPVNVNKACFEWGHRSEGMVAAKWAEDHKAIITEYDSFVSSAIPFMTASPDRLVLDANNVATAILEIKTAGFNFKSYDEDGELDRMWGKGNQYVHVRNRDGSESLQLVQADSHVPVYYYSQVLHYMIATGIYDGKLAVLIGGRDYRDYEIPFDREAAEALVRAEDEFFCKHILDDVAPAYTAKELANVTPEKKSSIEATPEMVEKATMLKQLTEKMAELKAQSDKLKDSLIEYLGVNENLTFNNKTIVSYSACKGRSSVDVDRLKEAYTALALANKMEPQEFTKQGGTYRRFSVKIKD